MLDNIIFLTDSYKVSHGKMLPKNTEKVYSYFESRKGSKFDSTVFYGLQIIIKKYLTGQVVTREKIEQASEMFKLHFGRDLFNREGWEHILNEYGGFLPIKIKAVPEGTIVDVNNVLMTVENTDPKCAFLTNYIETILTQVWYPTTVATLSNEAKKLLGWYLDSTRDFESTEERESILKYLLHDFGCRGTETMEASAIGGSAHLLSFRGTDTIPALTIPYLYYREPFDKVYGDSIPATEHSVMTSRGIEGEKQIMNDLLDEFPEGLLAVVIDSYNYEEFLEYCGTELKEKILNRNGRVIFRPDSGDIIDVSQKCIEVLGKTFGYTTNRQGYKVLNDKVRLIWGDGIDINGIDKILYATTKNGWASENWAFGMGGGLLQKVNRDVCRFAFKCSAQYYDNEWHSVQKSPLDKTKSSKPGLLFLAKIPVYFSGIPDGFKYETFSYYNEEQYLELMRKYKKNELVTVFNNGVLTREWTFDEIINTKNNK